tara:strand:+ start:1884 stop:2105 length:222 start_codon:yes stop_codon:yes gene_type:complete
MIVEFKDSDDLISVFDLDGFNGDDDIFIGSIKNNKDDGYFWFHPARGRIPLTCKQLINIANKLSELNNGLADR